jgi:hypothetical protein
MEELTQHLGPILQQCDNQEMQVPFILCAASPNGSVMAMRTDGENSDVLAEHYEEQGFALPITIMVLDQAGKAVRVTISQQGMTFH